MAGYKGKTDSGFEFELDESTFDDWELLESLREVDKGSKWAFSDVLESLFPDKADRDRLKEHCRGKNGRVSSNKMIHEILEIFKNAKAKNS